MESSLACIEKFDPERPKDRLGVVTVNALTGRIETPQVSSFKPLPLKRSLLTFTREAGIALWSKIKLDLTRENGCQGYRLRFTGKKMLQLDDVDSHQIVGDQSALIYVSPMSLLKPGDEQCVHLIPFDKSKPARVIARYSYVPTEIPSVQLLDDHVMWPCCESANSIKLIL